MILHAARLPPLLTVALLLGACTPDDQAPLDDTGGDGGGDTVTLPDYSAPGPWTAASTDVDIVGSTGVDLKVQIWYPTLETDGEFIRYEGFLEGAALDGATPDCATAHPVVACSHGNAGVRWQSPFFGEHLATHGWIVVAPDHTGNTTFDYDQSRFEEVTLRRPGDLADSVDWLLGESEAGGAYEGCADPSDGYGVVGHSFGGYTVYAASGAILTDPSDGASYELSDPRVWGGVAWAPWDLDGAIVDGADQIDIPLATMAGDLDETLTYSSMSNLHAQVQSTPRAFAEFPNAGHFSFSPVACDLGTVDGDGCGDAYIDLDLFMGLVKTGTLAFLAEAHGATGALSQLPEESDELIWTLVQ